MTERFKFYTTTAKDCPSTMSVFGRPDTEEIEVEVTYNSKVKSERFKWSWEPRFGIDAGDDARAHRIADRLLGELEAE